MTRRNWRKRMDKRVVISICQTGDKGAGSERVMAFVCRAENEANVIALAQRFIQRGSLVMSDESPAYNRLGSWFEHYSVQHSHEYSTDEGVNNNAAESWNSRIRRHEYGVSHGFRPKYIQDYACEMVWRENFRRACQISRVHALLKSMVQSPDQPGGEDTSKAITARRSWTSTISWAGIAWYRRESHQNN
ncbi:transposase [Xanthomonas campestris]|uniref:transposase n=1 Tax=Xanthomonas campestris TaxID=339 RepID=UPI00267544D3|nr:transposase [Xanthomonas campestris]